MEPAIWHCFICCFFVFKIALHYNISPYHDFSNCFSIHWNWFHSGDLAVIHPDGYVKIQDRSKDIIISGGENISSIEIENTLSKHPSVSIAAVVAKPDDKWGEVPCAFIEMVKDKPVSGKDLIDFCKETLAGFKVPKEVIFCELPKTSTGKIQKFELRKKF